MLSSFVMQVIDSFLHISTVIIVAWWYRATWWMVINNIRRCWRIIVKMVLLAVLTDGITALFFYIRSQGCYPVLPLWGGFLGTAVILFSLRLLPRSYGSRSFDSTLALLMGVTQGVALFPGISRFAITYTVARWYGCRPVKSFAISWMVYWPLMCAAVVKSIYEVWCHIGMMSYYVHDIFFYVVLMVATGIGYAAFAWAACLAQRDQLWWFGYYMIIPFLLAVFLG